MSRYSCPIRIMSVPSPAPVSGYLLYSSGKKQFCRMQHDVQQAIPCCNAGMKNAEKQTPNCNEHPPCSDYSGGAESAIIIGSWDRVASTLKDSNALWFPGWRDKACLTGRLQALMSPTFTQSQWNRTYPLSLSLFLFLLYCRYSTHGKCRKKRVVDSRIFKTHR